MRARSIEPPGDEIAERHRGRGDRSRHGLAATLMDYSGAARSGAHAVPPGTGLRFYLRRRAAFRRQGDVRERRVGRRAMPVLLFREDMHDVAGDDDLLLRLRGDDAFARRHEQNLVTAVRVHLVTRARAEVD